jgi:hypothetical protein
MKLIDLKSIPEIGSVLMVDHQPYKLVAIESYQRADGSPSSVLTWSVPCPECGDLFEVKSGLVCKAPNRRCKLHRSPGRKVKVIAP